MGMKSKRKGAAGELELARYLEGRGYPAHRGRQYSGGPDSPDIICPTLPVFVECKRIEKLSLYPALEQAQADTDGRPPAVFHRRNRKRWVVALYLDDFLDLVS